MLCFLLWTWMNSHLTALFSSSPLSVCVCLRTRWSSSNRTPAPPSVYTRCSTLTRATRSTPTATTTTCRWASARRLEEMKKFKLESLFRTRLSVHLISSSLHVQVWIDLFSKVHYIWHSASFCQWYGQRSVWCVMWEKGLRIYWWVANSSMQEDRKIKPQGYLPVKNVKILQALTVYPFISRLLFHLHQLYHEIKCIIDDSNSAPKT